MEKKEILQFEEDDKSKTSINGKQVFFTKRINGKTVHNKEVEEEIMNSQEITEKKNDNEELFIEFKNISYKPNNIPQNTNKKNKKNNTYKKNQNRKNVKINKNNQKRKKKNKFVKIIILILIVIAISIFALLSPIFNIDKFEIEGNELIDSNTIISLSGITLGKNIFQISKKNISNSIKENAYINDVSVKTKLPGTIQILVEERKVAYQIKVLNSYVYIDNQGYILEVASKAAKVPELEGIYTDQDILLNGKRLISSDLEILNVILRITETAKSAELYDKINKIKIENKQYILELKEDKKIVYLGNANNLTNQMTYVKLIVEKEKGNKGKIFVNGNISGGFKPYFREE